MAVAILGIDLAKRVFQLHGIDEHGRAVVSKRVSRAKLAEVVVQLAPRVVAMEACCGAHYWGRRFRELGLEVRLLHAKFVRPFVKSAKNEARDAEAICEAALRPHMIESAALDRPAQEPRAARHPGAAPRPRAARAMADRADQPDAWSARRAGDCPAAGRLALAPGRGDGSRRTVLRADRLGARVVPGPLGPAAGAGEPDSRS
jgi:transposase